jgi:Putative adhesin
MSTAQSMPTAKVVLLVALALTLITAVAVGATEALTKRETDTRTLMRSVDQVVVVADAGDVRLEAARADRVTLVSHRRWLWRKPKVFTRLTGSALDVRAECPEVGVLDRCAADLELRVPFDTDVIVRGGAGDIRADGLAGHVQLRTDAGNVVGTDLVPVSLLAVTKAGAIDLAFATSPVSVRASSDAGDVTVAVPSDEYRVDTATNAGDVRVQGVVRNDRSFRRIQARTDAGDVTVRGE